MVEITLLILIMDGNGLAMANWQSALNSLKRIKILVKLGLLYLMVKKKMTINMIHLVRYQSDLILSQALKLLTCV